MKTRCYLCNRRAHTIKHINGINFDACSLHLSPVEGWAEEDKAELEARGIMSMQSSRLFDGTKKERGESVY